jgi:hypothetical protein
MATRKKPGIRVKVKFYTWCIARGIDLKYFDPHAITFEPAKRVFSFYKDKQGTKDKYNYIFPDRVYNKQIREILNNN